MSEPAAIEPLPAHMSIQEYLRFDDATAGKHEYFSGAVIAMAGGTADHAAIAFNLNTAIGQKLPGKPCRGFSSDVRIGIPGVPSFSYPDMSVVCGPLKFDPRDAGNNTVINPTLIVEVLSPSTEGRDRGRKFENYLRLESLQEYVLVSQDHARVESYCRHPDGTWGAFAFAAGLHESLKLHSLDCVIPLSEIYANVVFPPAESMDGDKPATAIAGE
jgi:Uma2 family endonuclease